ncbi:MAG: hypothetical protein APF81_22415 [Desulfosporosinus sp. BRH_c37]|nr:MAG: hypothetical protein APF81_22415 [Desulfosporosinus sp. BRH_c37]
MITNIEAASSPLDYFFNRLGAATILINSQYQILWTNETFRNWFGSIKSNSYPCYKKIHGSKVPCSNCPTVLTLANNLTNYTNLSAIGINGRRNDYRFTSIPLRNSEDPSTNLVLEIIENIAVNPPLSEENKHNLAIFCLNQDGTIISTNPEHLELAQAPSEKVLGLNWLNLPKSYELGLSKYLQAGLRGEPFELFNFRYLTYHGDKEIYMNIKGLPLQRLDNNLKGLLCIALDTTDKQNQSGGKTPIIGQDSSVKAIIRHIQLVANYSCPVLIEGESGTGKELVAHEIFLKSTRKDQPFIIINAGAFQDALLESELFGHTKGAFSGAQNAKQGLFEIANNGTFFIDEVGEMSPAMQVKLLRILDNGVFRPVGSLKEIKVNVRIIAATNRNLEEEVKKGNFREDLFYRLNVFKLSLPPLHERGSDIALLAIYFLEQENHCYKVQKKFSFKAMDTLLHYKWPGNIRQLANVVKSAFILARNDQIEFEDLPQVLRSELDNDPITDIKPLSKVLAETEKNYILQALNAYNNDKVATAKALGISIRSLYRKLDKPIDFFDKGFEPQ